MKWSEIEMSDDQSTFMHRGKVLFKREFNKVMKFHEPGLAPVCDEKGWYHIKMDGNELYSARYEQAFGFYYGRAAVASGAKLWFHIDEVGRRVYPDNYSWAGNYQEDLCVVSSSNDHYFHIDKNGDRIAKHEYLYAGDFSEGAACVMIPDKTFTHIKRDGTYLHGKFFKDIGIYHKGFATAKDSRGWFHIGRMGQAIYDARFALLEPFYNGQAFAEDLSDRKCVIDMCGKIITTFP